MKHIYAVVMLATLAAAPMFSVAAQSSVSPAVMQGLSRQLKIDVPAMRDCATKTKYNFSASAVDLNGDKQPEYLLTSVGACECGQVNCSQWVYRAHDQSFELLLEAEGYVLNVAKGVHNAYRDLATTSRNNAVIVDHVSYAYNGKRYERTRSTIENLDTHEIKPTQQEIHFARGASSAIVTGSAALAFPDSWTFGATQGQTLSVVLDRVSGAETIFTLIAPSKDGGRVVADQKTKWNDKLPADGVYTILVDTKGDGRATYKLTIGIR